MTEHLALTRSINSGNTCDHSETYFRDAGPLSVRVEGKAGTTSRVVIVRFLPIRSWAQNLCLTPSYVNELKTFEEVLQSDVKAHILFYAQHSCVRHPVT